MQKHAAQLRYHHFASPARGLPCSFRHTSEGQTKKTAPLELNVQLRHAFLVFISRLADIVVADMTSKL